MSEQDEMKGEAMFVRVFDKENQTYFKSIAYGIVNNGYFSQYIVRNPVTCCFELVDYLDKDSPDLTPLVEMIQRQREDWVVCQEDRLLQYNAFWREHGIEPQIRALCGYCDVCNDTAFLTTLLQERRVPVSETNISVRQLPDCDTWRYIQTQVDAGDFMKAFAYFHDATLDKLLYEEEWGMSKATATFANSRWYGSVELCFEGVLAVNLRPPRENYDRYFGEGSLLVNQETVFWADGCLEKEDLTYQGNYIQALNVKWRKIA